MSKTLTTLTPADIRAKYGTHFNTVGSKDTTIESNKEALASICGGSIECEPYFDRVVFFGLLQNYRFLQEVYEEFGPKDPLNEWSHQHATVDSAIASIQNKAKEAIERAKAELINQPKLFHTALFLARLHLLPKVAREHLFVASKLVNHLKTYVPEFTKVKVNAITARTIDSKAPVVGENFWIAGNSYGRPFLGKFVVDDMSYYDQSDDGELTWTASVSNVDENATEVKGMAITKNNFDRSEDDGKSFPSDLYGYQTFRDEASAKAYIQDLVDKQMAMLKSFKV